jgi:hypothetical protein
LKEREREREREREERWGGRKVAKGNEKKKEKESEMCVLIFVCSYALHTFIATGVV